jgi:hypothetical protein
VDVGVEGVALGRLEPDDLTQLDVLLEQDLHVVDGLALGGGGTFSLGGDRIGDLLDQPGEGFVLGHEVRLALELGDGGHVAHLGDGDRSLAVVAVLAGG